MKRKTIALCLLLSTVISGCGGMSAQDLVNEYSDKAKEKAVEIAKESAIEAASSINENIEQNETANTIKESVNAAGEYAQDAYEYATDKETIDKAKNAGNKAVDDSKNFFSFLFDRLEQQWSDLKEDFVKPPEEFTTNPFDDMENISDYDFYGNYKNIFQEAKGIDTSSNGTAMDQLKEAYKNASISVKQTISDIKSYHDQKHNDSESSTDNYEDKSQETSNNNSENSSSTAADSTEVISKILLPIMPAYSGSPYIIVNDNVPFFSDEELTTEPFEYYSELDSLGRVGVAYANICKEIMPTEERGSIGTVKPTGFIQKRYQTLIDSDNNPYGYLYARCHLIAYTLAGENANPLNLTTGTFYFNVEGMEPFELMTSYYVKSTGHHVLYRVTPIFDGNDLVAKGVLMEARSVEDNNLSFCAFIYNVAPSVTINYATGESSLAE